MKKVSKAILIGLAAVLVLMGILLLSLNLYVQSAGAQARIQEELSKALRLPLKITNTSVSAWSGLQIRGISIPNGDANFLEATSFSASYRLLPLLRGKLIIPEMRVESPRLIWRQDAEGKWKLPTPEKAAAIAKEESAIPNPEAAPAKKKNFTVLISRFDVQDGAFNFFDKDGKPVAVFSGVNMTYTKLSAEEVEGTASIGTIVWADGLTFENVQTPFFYKAAGQEMRAPDLTANFAGGTLRGNYASHAEGEQTPFEAKLEFEHLDLDRLMTQSGGGAGQATGELRGNFAMHGRTEKMDKAEGAGRVEVRDGQFRQLELFQNIGGALGLRGFSNLRLKEGFADFRLKDEKIEIEPLVLTTSDLQLTSKGTVRLKDKKVALESQLALDEKLVPDLVKDSFATAEDHRRTIDFNITGTTDRLKTNLLDKLVGQKINAQFGDLLGNLFGGKKDDKKKKEEEERKKAEKKEKKRKEKEQEAAANAAPPPAPAAEVPPPAPAPNP